MSNDNQFQADPTEVAAAFIFMGLEALAQTDKQGCVEVAHRLDMFAAKQRSKSLQNAYLRAADACRQVAIHKDPAAIERWKGTRHTSKP